MRKSFDLLARPYRILETLLFGSALQRARIAHLDALASAKRVLIVGEGDGRFLSALLESNARCSVHVVDDSSAMLATAQARVARQTRRRDPEARVAFTQADARSYPFDSGFDAVVTLFFLDCFEGDELLFVITKLAGAIRQGGVWIYADFSDGRGQAPGFWHAMSRVWVWVLYRVFGLLTDIRARRLCDPLPALTAAGFDAETTRWHAQGLLRTCILRRPHAAPPQSTPPSLSQT